MPPVWFSCRRSPRLRRTHVSSSVSLRCAPTTCSTQAPEEAFDTLTRIAAEVCRTDIALITLVDEARQWFKPSVGIDIGETPRDVSFCGHAIIGDDVFVVDDATKEDRFAGNPFVVAESGARMCAGAPLISAEGLAVGTLYVISDRPGHLDQAQLRMLRTLAAQVVSHLELRAVSSRLAHALEDKSEVERALRHEASHDQLTGLANRRLSSRRSNLRSR